MKDVSILIEVLTWRLQEKNMTGKFNEKNSTTQTRATKDVIKYITATKIKFKQLKSDMLHGNQCENKHIFPL